MSEETIVETQKIGVQEQNTLELALSCWPQQSDLDIAEWFAAQFVCN